MKKLIFFFYFLAHFGAIYTTDSSNNNYPYQWLLEGSIESPAPIEIIRKDWKTFQEKNSLSKSEITQAAAYFLHYAQTLKSTIEQEKVAWGDRKHNVSKLKWGGVKLLVGAWGTAGSFAPFLIDLDRPSGKSVITDPSAVSRKKRLIFYSFFPDKWLLDRILPPNKYISGPLLSPMSVTAGTLWICSWFCRLAFWLVLTGGMNDITNGLNYPAHLEERLKKLAAIITFFEPLSIAAQ